MLVENHSRHAESSVASLWGLGSVRLRFYVDQHGLARAPYAPRPVPRPKLHAPTRREGQSSLDALEQEGEFVDEFGEPLNVEREAFGYDGVMGIYGCCTDGLTLSPRTHLFWSSTREPAGTVMEEIFVHTWVHRGEPFCFEISTALDPSPSVCVGRADVTRSRSTEGHTRGEAAGVDGLGLVKEPEALPP